MAVKFKGSVLEDERSREGGKMHDVWPPLLEKRWVDKRGPTHRSMSDKWDVCELAAITEELSVGNGTKKGRNDHLTGVQTGRKRLFWKQPSRIETRLQVCFFLQKIGR